MAEMRTPQSIRDVVDRVSYPGFEFLLSTSHAEVWLQVSCKDGVNTVTGEPEAWKGRKWKLSYYATDTEIVQTAWAAVERALLHEASELFKYRGAAIYNRHLDVDLLAELAVRPDAEDSRDNAMQGLGD
ncbi:hypothetical protein HOT99_gp202 [Caulobacter phage CcrBL10]|uniref:Uncharacterized protein n=1 Tax=Caulobacter phage CcrBL10 TaxID=2283269 RepID=A0A385EBQ1_9CAUD|nr:hypothetical protein HOT99_gp202 [Caulobacter phage CcrBL10]AXQ68415.1 hypothetical protein CcrBL10_gp211c [Caulobacter phage CcrBL10]